VDGASIWYLGVTFTLFALFVLIVVRTYRRKNRAKGETPKYRMLDGD
jgi:membrane protein implicated in regulation of membrane protease activity